MIPRKSFKKNGSANFTIHDFPIRPNPKKLSGKEIRKLPYGTAYITKRGKIAWKQYRKENFIDWWIMVMEWVVYPFYQTGRFILRTLYGVFYPKSNFRHNGVFGPGGRTSYDQNFSCGRLSFIIVVSFIIIYFIFLR